MGRYFVRNPRLAGGSAHLPTGLLVTFDADGVSTSAVDEADAAAASAVPGQSICAAVQSRKGAERPAQQGAPAEVAPQEPGVAATGAPAEVAPDTNPPETGEPATPEV